MTAEMVPAPWERQPGEPARAFAAFCLYRDMPAHERSLRAVAERLSSKGSGRGRRSTRPLERWSTRWRWVERARAWDDEQDRIAREAQLRAVQEMRERHAREAMALQSKALERLRQMDPAELSPRDVLWYFVEAAKLERLARGEPDAIEEQRHNVTGYAAEVLAAWERRLRGITDGGASQPG